MDATFYGFALSFASFTTILPLFFSTLTNSTMLIGMVAAVHSIGWFFPQLLTAKRVGRLSRYRPMVLGMTLHERLPYFLLAGVAFLAAGVVSREIALLLAFGVVIWQALGAGLTATAWQSMIAKVIPDNMRGTFYGIQSSAANLTGIGGAVLAGVLVQTLPAPWNFTLPFVLCGIFMMVSFVFLARTREPAIEPPKEMTLSWREFIDRLIAILRENPNYRWFIVARMVTQVATIGSAFYTVYAVRQFNVEAGTLGLMTGVMSLALTLATPLFGWLGDRYSHRLAYAVGMVLIGTSAVIALVAPSAGWFYVVFALVGASNGALWTTPMALTVEFCSESERPYYIGLTSTLIGPVSLFVPLLGGWLADSAGFGSTFALAVVGAAVTAVMLVFVVREPRHVVKTIQPVYANQAMD